MQTPPIKNDEGSRARNKKRKATRYAWLLEKIFQANSVDDTESLPYVGEQEEGF